MNYQAKWKEVPATFLRNGNFKVYSMPLPSGGQIYQFILNILDGTYL